MASQETNVMMALGEYRFSIDTAAYQSFSRNTKYRWQSQTRIGRNPAQQYLGLGEDTISMNGVIYPEYKGGLFQLDHMRAAAGAGEPLALVDGMGYIWGDWVITDVNEKQTEFLPNGAPLKLDFTMNLKRYGEDT